MVTSLSERPAGEGYFLFLLPSLGPGFRPRPRLRLSAFVQALGVFLPLLLDLPRPSATTHLPEISDTGPAHFPTR